MSFWSDPETCDHPEIRWANTSEGGTVYYCARCQSNRPKPDGYVKRDQPKVSVPVDERRFVSVYGELPSAENRQRLRELWDRTYGSAFELEWEFFWRNSHRDADLLERLYIFWNDVRTTLRDWD